MSFRKILENFNQENESNLNLIKVQFFTKDNLIKIILYSKEREQTIIDAFNDLINQQIYNSKIEIKFYDLDEMIEFFIAQVRTEVSLLSEFTRDAMNITDDRITIKLISPLMQDRIVESSSFDLFNNMMRSSGIEVDFDTSIDESTIKIVEEINMNKNIKIQEEFKQQVVSSAKKKKIIKKSDDDKSMFSYGFKKKTIPPQTSVENLIVDHNEVTIIGTVYETKIVEVKSGAFVKFDIDDGKYAVRCKRYVRKDDLDKFNQRFSNGIRISVCGVYKYDEYDKSDLLDVSFIQEVLKEEYGDDEVDKRIEFNIHTKYSNLEGLVDISDLMKRLKDYGHEAFGVTDTYNVQSYPEIYAAGKKNGIKVNLGCEFKMLEDKPSIITNNHKLEDLDNKSFVVFDIETTGLSKFNDRITEIGAVKIVDGKIISSYQKLVNPEMVISDFITNLTGITNEMVANEPKIDVILPDFIEYCGDSILVAQNAEFDIGFIHVNCLEQNIDFTPAYIDTMWLARVINTELKNHKLGTLAKTYGVRLQNHHRASDDATATGEIFIKMMDFAIKEGYSVTNINDLTTDYNMSRNQSFYNLVYVKNQIGLKNMYKNISQSSIDYLYRTPGLPWHILEKNRDGLLISSGSHKTKLFGYIADGYPDEIILNEARNFDFLTVEPLSFYTNLVGKGLVKDENHFKSVTKKIIDIADKLSIPVIAVGNVYYLEENDYVFKNILANYPIKRRIAKKGDFYLRNTSEMLDEFNYLDEQTRNRVVIFDAHKVNDMIEDISPIAKGTFPPVQENAEQILRDSSYEKAQSIYGNPLPKHVKDRLDRELNSIISNGYATLYMIAKQLVKKSNDDGYLVGSRGSVGSSFAATMAEITEVNPLEPHYICPNCKHSEFILDQSYGTGVDLPDKNCPKCGEKLNKDGFDIPFEVFLGFEGDKEPDIDLNFAGVYQSSIHKYTETMFGDRKVFRAGTLGTIAEKTAYGMARKFKEHYPEDQTIRIDPANIDKIKRKLVGVKRTTGQHAGGLIIVPDNKDIEDFTPIQYPADQKESGVITTHFDYHAIDQNLLKLDLLGHNAPSIIRMLTDDSSLDALTIDLSDKDTMTIFSSTEALNIKHDYTNSKSATLGIPEFGTLFVREMLADTMPTTFEELVRISGLSHGTDVWINNAQELIKNGTTVLKNAICTRDDIMNYLIANNMNSKLAFDIMEKVRKGKGLSESDEAEMKRLKIPNWYIDSCNKIKYMFPRAHAVAYVMMSYRIAYYKVHYPEYFYSTYFTNKIADFQYSIISKDLDYITMYLKEYKNSENFDKDDKFYCVELAEEMKARDIDLLQPDLYKSDPEKFIVVEKGKILPPLMAITNVSQQIALRIAKAREDGEFISIEDFSKRTKVNKTALASMETFGMFEGLQKSNQLSFLDF